MHTLPRRVLLIEDDDGAYQVIKHALAHVHTPFALRRVIRLQEGLSELAISTFDVVLTDLSLPDSTGLGSVRRLREFSRETTIVVLTTLEDNELEAEALNLGVQDFLSKVEITPYLLERSLQHAIQRQQNLLENQRLLSRLKASRELLAQQKSLLEHKNRRLRKLYRMAHRFVGNVSHDFRTPLAVIKDYVALVREGLVGELNDEQRRMLAIVNVRADDLNTMVDDMLDVTKLDAGLCGCWRRACRLGDIVHSMLPALQQRAAVKNISFETAIDDNLPEVYCDDKQVDRIIINLVVNAMKFCGDPGMVRLWAMEDASRQELVVGVTDNGAGIGSKELSKIFKRFKQLKTRVNRDTKGFGLGLNIAKELVHLNLGEIRVESVVGKGSTFSFTLPLAQPLSVMRRYVDRVHRRRRTSYLSLIRAHIHGSAADVDAEDMETFFHFLLRSNDLLFPLGNYEWLLVIATPRAEVGHFITRARSELEKTNRNRPYVPLPDFEMNIEGSWRLAQAQEMLAHLAGILQSAIDQQS